MVTDPVKTWLKALLTPHIDNAHAVVVKSTADAATVIPSSLYTAFSQAEEEDSQPSSSTGSSPTYRNSTYDTSVPMDSTALLPNSPVVALHNQLAKVKKDVIWTTTSGTSHIEQDLIMLRLCLDIDDDVPTLEVLQKMITGPNHFGWLEPESMKRFYARGGVRRKRRQSQLPQRKG